MVGPLRLRNGMCLLIRLEMPEEKAAICSWMYIKKVSDDHRPCFRMVSRSSPLSFMAMAPPARREWLLTRSAEKPQRCNLRALVAALTALLIWEDSTCRVRPRSLYAERGVSRSLVKARIWDTRRARDWTGQCGSKIASLWMTAPFVPFFWLVSVSVAASAERRSAESELSGRTSPFFQNFTSRTRNCWVRRLAVALM